jgi:hypothetical protein
VKNLTNPTKPKICYLKEGTLPKGTRKVKIILNSEIGQPKKPELNVIYGVKQAQDLIEEAYEKGQVRSASYEVIPWTNPHPMTAETKAKLRK